MPLRTKNYQPKIHSPNYSIHLAQRHIQSAIKTYEVDLKNLEQIAMEKTSYDKDKKHFNKKIKTLIKVHALVFNLFDTRFHDCKDFTPDRT